ncbi:MAG: hypothetical protein WC547_06305 [Candidatus Omnitrophota bacterium]
MIVRKWLAAGCVVFLSCAVCFAQQDEKLTITTYYPSPTGVYNHLQSNRMTVGDFNNDNLINSNDLPDQDGELAVAKSLYLRVSGSTAAPGVKGGEGLRIRSDVNYFGPDVDAVIIEQTEDDQSVNGGMILGFATSAAENTNYSQPGWAVNSTPVITLRGTGNVGIGTANPVTGLHVSGDNDVAARITSTHTAMAGSPSMYMGMNEGNNAGLIELTAGKDFKLWNGQYALTVNGTTGNVGIGTTAPTAQLEVAKTGGDATFRVMQSGGSNGYITSQTSRTVIGTAGETDLQLRTNNTDRLLINSTTGNVGIGTVTPVSALHVVGDCRLQGNITVGSNYLINASCALVVNSTTGGNVFCHCPEGKYVFTGGCSAAGVTFDTNWPVNTTTWRCSSTTTTSTLNCRVKCCNIM